MWMLHKLISNYTLLATVLSWITAQVLKTFITFINTRKFVPERMFGAGGMPSAHSASVSALSICMAHSCGVGSPEFALSAAFAAVVIYDAMGVRRAAGEQAKVINKMVNIWEENGYDVTDKELKEFLGHTPLEVLTGIMVGILMGLALA